MGWPTEESCCGLMHGLVFRHGGGAPTVLMGHEWNEESADFVSWIDSKLRERGIKEELYVVTLLNKKYALETNKKLKGSYMWEPAMY